MTDEDITVERRQRLEITFDDPPENGAPEEAPEIDVSLRSAALVRPGGTVPISGAGLLIGSDPAAEVLVEDHDVAPQHARIVAVTGGHVLVDGGSGAPTYINGDRLQRGEERILESGDTVAVGQQIFHYLPAGSRGTQLAPIAPVDAGRIRAAHDRFMIGRSPSADLVLDHPTVSAEHALIRQSDGRMWIEDLGTSTGLRVNGALVKRAPLAVGDQIGIGPFRIVYDGIGLVSRSASKGLAITALGVHVIANGHPILQPTSIQVRPGELVAIIGESGAGKSTLLKVLAGVNRATGGIVLAGGEPLATRLPEVGYVPQFDIVHEKLTVREALDYAARLRLPYDLTDMERTARVKQVLEQLQLAERADVLVEHVSGGQRKRAAVGTELLHQPGVLFLDEPTTGLDPGLERRLMELLRSLASSGQTVALVTHATGSLALCDRVIVMGEGTVQFDGTPDELLETFEVENFEDVYTVLARPESAQAVQAAAPSERPLPPVSRGAVKQVHQPFAYQALVLARRYTTVFRRDKRHVRSALIQVPILALLSGLLFKPLGGIFNSVYDSSAGAVDGGLHTPKSAQLLFILVIVTLWLGSINAAREIIKERNILQREFAVGVQIPAYLASKLAILLTFSGIQTALFSFIVFVIQPPHASLAATAGLTIVLVLTSWIGVLLGLLVSALATSEDHATGVIPLLLVPQLLLGGAIVTLKDMGPMKLVADITPARWSFAAAGRAIDLDGRISRDPGFRSANPYPDGFFALHPILFLLVVALFAAALIGALVYLLRRPRFEQ